MRPGFSNEGRGELVETEQWGILDESTGMGVNKLSRGWEGVEFKHRPQREDHPFLSAEATVPDTGRMTSCVQLRTGTAVPVLSSSCPWTAVLHPGEPTEWI